MFKEKETSRYWRSILTDTLPYEVPVIFSNEILYASLVKPSDDPKISNIVQCLRNKHAKYTIPYSYQIAKDEKRVTTLGIIHPNLQLEFADFYELYKQSLLDYCSTREISLRRPASEMPFFAETEISNDQELKTGIPHVRAEDGQIEVSKMTSYFSYERYNLLARFYDAPEFRDLEKKFRMLRVADVSKCFFHIYTHSVTWAVKGKPYAKQYTDAYSFEAVFDKLMQRSNYNETNGIVIGPETSRIFAEIIFQEIDRRLVEEMKPTLIHDQDYAVRRYVDDYFIFATSDKTLDKVTVCLEKHLEHFKLFLNGAKTKTYPRPFVSDISLARSELKSVSAAMGECLDALNGAADSRIAKRQARELRRLADDVRLISERYKVTFNVFSGWLSSSLRAHMAQAVGAIRSSVDASRTQSATDMAIALLNIIFHIAALDLRVRPTYTLCQVAELISRLDVDATSDAFDVLSFRLRQELDGLVSSLLREPMIEDWSGTVEMGNLLITGAHFCGTDFLEAPGAQKALEAILKKPSPSYFDYITAKFCFLKDEVKYSGVLAQLNASIRARLDSGAAVVGTDAELYLLLCDYLSAPDVSKSDKRTMIEKVCGGSHSNDACHEAGRYLSFVDWRGVRLVHILARRQLRPVYSWS